MQTSTEKKGKMEKIANRIATLQNELEKNRNDLDMSFSIQLIFISY